MGETVLGYLVTTIIDSQNCVAMSLFAHPDFTWSIYDMEPPVTSPDEEVKK